MSRYIPFPLLKPGRMAAMERKLILLLLPSLRYMICSRQAHLRVRHKRLQKARSYAHTCMHSPVSGQTRE